MNKHTPGPWNVTEPHEKRQIIRIAGPEGRLGVADAYGDTSGEAQANAALIAAAPDLLTALETISAWLVAPATRPEDIAWAKDIARAAIAKATGETT